MKKIDLRSSVIRIECEKEKGAGFLVSQEGYVLTSAHLISNARNTTLFLYNEKLGFSEEYKATEIYYCDPSIGDFCLLKLKEAVPSNYKVLPLFYPTQSEGHPFLTYGFPDSNPYEGLEGKGIVQKHDLISENRFPIIQLEESNSITRGFSGSLIFDTEIGGVIGLIQAGVLDNQRQLNTSFGIPISYISEKCSDDYQLNIREPNQVIELPKYFTYLLPPKTGQVSPFKIKYQDFLQSNNLPYFSRDSYKTTHKLNDDFVTESLIIDKLLKSHLYEGGIIFGEGGIGKTRLMFEIGQTALRQGWVVIQVEPEAAEIEEILPFLTPDYKYLFLFDYIEDSNSFNEDIVSTLYQKNEQLTLRVLANCRYTFRPSSNFPDTFLQFELRDNENEKKYRHEVTQYITQDLTNTFPVKNEDFYNIKPSFAVFLKLLLVKEQLETDDIREAGDFKSWIKKRFRLTFKKDDFSELDKKVIYFLSSLPLKGENIETAYSSGFSDICQKLKNDGWIEEIESSVEPVLKVIHDTIVDELLILHLESNIKDVKREITQILKFSSQFESQNNWLRSMERIIEHDVFFKKTYFYDIFNQQLKKNNTHLIEPLKYFLITSPIFGETNRINLLHTHLEFFRESIEHPFFAKPLSFALNRERNTTNLTPKFEEIFTTWHQKNKNFNHSFNFAYRITSTYTKYFGLDDFAQDSILKYLRFHSAKPQSSYVIQAWLENGGNINSVKEYVINYLNKNSEDNNVQYVLSAWLKNGGSLDDVRPYIFTYLNKNSEYENSEYVIVGWLNNGGLVDEIQSYIFTYLNKNSQHKDAQYVLVAWLNSNGQDNLIKPYLFTYLDAYGQHESTQYILAAWLNKVEYIEDVKPFIFSYLDQHKEITNTSFILQAWLDSGRQVDVIWEYMQAYLNKNAQDPNIRFILASWLENGGNLDNIRQYILAYLKENIQDPNIRFILQAWLDNSGDINAVQKYVIRFLKENAQDPNASFIFQTWFNNGGKIDAVREYVLAYLKKNAQEPNASFVFKAWFSNGGKIDTIQEYVVAYLKENAQEPNASFVFQAWFSNEGKINTVQEYVVAYLKENAQEPNASFVFQAWFSNRGEINTIQEYVLAFLEKNAQDLNATFVLQDWFNNGGKIEPIQEHVITFLEKNAQDPNSRFVLAPWIENGGDIDTIIKYVLVFLKANAAEFSTSFFYKPWLEKTKNLQLIEHFFFLYLNQNVLLQHSGHNFGYWIKYGGNIEKIKPLLIKYLNANASSEEAFHLIKGVFENKVLEIMSMENFERYVDIFIRSNIQLEETQKVLAPWINSKESTLDLESLVKSYLELHAHTYGAQYVISTWLKNNGNISTIEPFLKSYLIKNTTQEKTGYIFLNWLNAGGTFNKIEAPLRLWYLKNEASNVAKTINFCLLNNGIVQESYKEIL